MYKKNKSFICTTDGKRVGVEAVEIQARNPVFVLAGKHTHTKAMETVVDKKQLF